MAETIAEKSVSLRVLTHSAISTFKRCRKLYKFSYVDRLRPIAEKKAFAFGHAGHAAVNILETIGIESALIHCRNAKGLDPFERETLAALIRGYADRYPAPAYAVVSREEMFIKPIVNPETGAASRTFQAGGKVDGKITLQNESPALVERKFLKESLDPKLWNRLLIDPQISHYCINTNTEVVVYDVIRKPAMAPYLATPIADRKYKKDGTLYANQREFDETPEEWHARLYDDICSRPEFYYWRAEIPRLYSDLDQYRQELWDVARDIREAELNDRWYRNVSSINCNNCAFYDPCTGTVPYDGTHAPAGFQFVDDPNQELLE